jgi:hypothetical protein
VGGYRWMMKGRTFFARHLDFVRANGLSAVAQRARQGENFWLDPEIGPWGSPAAVYPEFGARLAAFDLNEYVKAAERSRDALFNDTMPSGASGAELMKIETPSFILPGNDSSHAYSASVALKELMPNAELWDALPAKQNGRNTLEEILRFTSYLERRASARS